MAHEHPVVDADKHFLIDPVTRVVKNSESKKTTLVQNDHNSERLSFEVDRYIEGHDMLESANVRIHYDNVGTNRLKTSGVYEVDDIQPNPEDSTKVIFTWLISQNCTSLVGVLNFSITFECETDGVVEYRWSTVLNTTDVYISEGLDNSGAVASTYVDILTKWKNELYSIVYTYPTFAEVCRWEDDNLDDEYRIGYFVTAEASDITEEVLMVKATAGSDIRGVTMESPGFAANAGDYKFDEKGELLPQYEYVGFSGFIPVIDNGLCSVNGWCKSGDNGTAVPAEDATGFRVIERVDETHVLILVEPQGSIATLIEKDTEIVNALTEHVNANNPHGMSPESIGALPIAGGTLTGGLAVSGGIGAIHGFTGGEGRDLDVYVTKNDDNANTRRVIRMLSDVDISKALRLVDIVDGKTTPYNLYGEHNKPTVADVGAVNPNLLHNWYFGNPVNRNGFVSEDISGSKFITIDRWCTMAGRMSVSVEDGYIKLTAGTDLWFMQVLDKNLVESLSGEVVTISALTNNNTLHKFTFNAVFPTSGFDNNVGFATYVNSSTGLYAVGFYGYSNAEYNIIAIKLELGDQQTLAHQDANGNWVLNEIPDYAEQMAICSQYNATTGEYMGFNAASIGALKVYGDLSELGLSEATATADDIVNAMVDNSILLHRLSGTATSAALAFPNDYYLLQVTKRASSYARFECIGAGIGSLVYYGYYNSGAPQKWSGWSTKFLPLTGGTLKGQLSLSDTLNSETYKNQMKLVQYGGVSRIRCSDNNKSYSDIYLSLSGALYHEIASEAGSSSKTVYTGHNITAGTTDLVAGSSPLGNDCYYDVYK